MMLFYKLVIEKNHLFGCGNIILERYCVHVVNICWLISNIYSVYRSKLTVRCLSCMQPTFCLFVSIYCAYFMQCTMVGFNQLVILKTCCSEFMLCDVICFGHSRIARER